MGEVGRFLSLWIRLIPEAVCIQYELEIEINTKCGIREKLWGIAVIADTFPKRYQRSFSNYV